MLKWAGAACVLNQRDGMMITTREETSADIEAISALTAEAFAGSEFGHNGEAELIGQLRESCGDSLSMVANSADAMVGHVLFTPVVIRGEQEVHGMGLERMSVDPAMQRTGVGSRLIAAGLERLARDRCPFVVVLGHPSYYPRFGFLPASQYGVSHGFAGIPQHVFFMRALEAETAGLVADGAAYYRPEFGAQHCG